MGADRLAAWRMYIPWPRLRYPFGASAKVTEAMDGAASAHTSSNLEALGATEENPTWHLLHDHCRTSQIPLFSSMRSERGLDRAFGIPPPSVVGA